MSTGAKIAIIIVLIIVLIAIGVGIYLYTRPAETLDPAPWNPIAPQAPLYNPGTDYRPVPPPPASYEPAPPAQAPGSQAGAPPPPSAPALKWSTMNNWFSYGNRVGGELPTSTSATEVKKMCEDLQACKVASRQGTSKPWRFYRDFAVPRWEKDSKSLINERSRLNYNKPSPFTLPLMYKEVPGVNPFAGGNVARQYLKKEVNLATAKKICDGYASKDECTAVTQDAQGNYTLWRSLTSGPATSGHKVWLNFFNPKFNAGKL